MEVTCKMNVQYASLFEEGFVIWWQLLDLNGAQQRVAGTVLD